MRGLTIGALLVMTISLTAAPARADVTANKELVSQAMKTLFEKRDPAALEEYFAADYVNRNPMAGPGLKGLQELAAQLKSAPGVSARYVRIIAEGDLVATHGTYSGLGQQELIAFDIFRIKDGKIAEHWDNLAPVAGPNLSGRTQIDGDTVIADLEKTGANKALVTEFVTRVLINHENVDITNYINPEKYLQHNPNVADGLEGFGAFLADIQAKGIEMSYKKVHLSVAEGNFVLTASEGTFGGAAMAFYDLFRLEEGRIVEHWDVIANMPSGSLPVGYPGKF